MGGLQQQNADQHRAHGQRDGTARQWSRRQRWLHVARPAEDNGVLTANVRNMFRL
jgi:hypothetical protein